MQLIMSFSVAAVLLWLVIAHGAGLAALATRAGARGPVPYVVAYALLAAAFVPAGPLTMLAGALYGAVAGAEAAFVGATTGALLAFTASRYVARSRVEARVARSPRLAAIVRAVAADGRRIVFLLRLSPVIPFSAINVVMAVTPIRIADFALGCIGMIPVTLLYAWYGSVAGALVAMRGRGAPRGAAHYVMLAAGLLATLAVTAIIGRIARRALDDSIES